MADGSLARGQQRLAAGAGGGLAWLARYRRRPEEDRLADRGRSKRRQAALLLEQLRAAHALGADGGVRASTALGGAFHEEAKELLGWDQYQGRLWTGFHRNSVLVMLAYSFLVWQEFQQRQEQPARAGRGGLFPLVQIDVGCHCRRYIARSATGSGSKRPRSCCCVNS